MKKILFFAILLNGLAHGILAQEKEKPTLSINADLVSRYVWRGTDYGEAPGVQPSLAMTYKGFVLGAWGNFSISSNTGGTETDLYAGYTFPFGLGLTFTDYFFPLEVTRWDPSTQILSNERIGNYFNINNHIFEASIKQTIGGFYLSANYYLNFHDDLYFETGYNWKNLGVFLGAGNQSYTLDGDFDVCNIGVRYQRPIHFNEKFKITPFSSIVVNPSSEQMHFVLGLTI